MKNKLTVLVPTFNNNKALTKIIDVYKNDQRVEIIVSDDSDNKREKSLIKSSCEVANVHYFEGPRTYPVDNWNKLLKMVNTPFFVLNHHDEYPDNLDFLDELDNEKLGLLILPCSSKVPGRNFHNIETWQQYIFTKFCRLFNNASFNMLLAPTASVIVSNDLKDILFDKNLKWYVDAEWYLKLFNEVKFKKFKTKFYPFSRVFSIQASNSITLSLKNRLKEQIKYEKKYLNSIGLFPGEFINLIQFFCLAAILFKTKLKQLFGL